MAKTKKRAIDVGEEEDFHNKWADSIEAEKVLVVESFESSTAVENKHALSELGRIKGKKILDLGCGAGEASVYFATKGAEAYALDISEGMLKTAQKIARKYKTKIKTVKASAEELPFADGFFDLVYGNAVLHHINIEPTIAEVSRVLKPRGRAVFIEPVAYNPAINVYRKMAMDVRTVDEHPLKSGDIKMMKKYFKQVGHKEFWFITLLIFFYFFFIERIHPKKERYWKKVTYDEKKYRSKFLKLKKIDDIVLKIFPPVRWLCWNTVISLKK